MIRENWMFWIILVAFIGNSISVFLYAAGFKKDISWKGNLTDRCVGIVVCIALLVVYAISLGWL